MSTCSPLSHLGYLKHWSKILNLPIVSIEYSLAPEHKHPTALNECFKVYTWLLKNSHQLGLRKGKIIVGGDRFDI
jgi:acetyl esterase/lipase